MVLKIKAERKNIFFWLFSVSEAPNFNFMNTKDKRVRLFIFYTNIKHFQQFCVSTVQTV